MREAGDPVDPREVQINRLNEITNLKQRLTDRDQTISELTEFKTEALARLAAQHDEIDRLSQRHDQSAHLHHLPNRKPALGPGS